MHGGKVLLRSTCENISFPKNVNIKPATKEDLDEVAVHIKDFCKYFGCDENKILNEKWTIVSPDSNNPYKQMYVQN